MFIVVLRFSSEKAKAGQFMEGHKEWIRRGFDDGVFVITGSVKAEILEVTPSRADPRLAFLA